jgi:putative transposase
MFKSYKYRIYPTKQQEILINKHIGACRFVYNLALETKLMAYTGNKINISCFDLTHQLLDLKKEYIWLKEINAQSLQQSIINLDKSYTNFFKGYSNFPKFKKKNRNQSFSSPQSIIIKNNKLFIPKFREGIKIVLHRGFTGKIKRATISRTPTNKYFVSILIDTQKEAPIKQSIKENTTIGVDLGIKSFLVTSNNQIFDNPKYLRNNLPKLKYIQRKYSKYKGKRTKHKLALLHEKIANQRKDFLDKTSMQLIKNHDSIAIEDLNIQGMVKNHKLAQSILDVGWGMFIIMLEYKAEWYGKNILRIGRFDPSSKTCSNCGSINKELKLQDRKWTCKHCGSILDRDINAAINIKSFALKNYLSMDDRLKNQNELPTLVGVLTSEVPN